MFARMSLVRKPDEIYDVVRGTKFRLVGSCARGA
jgi:hypothetical protein